MSELAVKPSTPHAVAMQTLRQIANEPTWRGCNLRRVWTGNLPDYGLLLSKTKLSVRIGRILNRLTNRKTAR